MPTLSPSAATGAHSKPQEMTYVEPARTMTPEEDEAFLADAGLNGPFVADLLSDMLAHERCGAQLYRSVSQRTNSAVVREHYDHFGNETVERVEILEVSSPSSAATPAMSARPPGPPRRPGWDCWSPRSFCPARWIS